VLILLGHLINAATCRLVRYPLMHRE